MVRSTLFRGVFSAKSGVKTCKVTDLHKNIGILHFKPCRIRISRWFFHWLTFEGVENQDFQEHVSILDTFRGFSQGKWTNRSPPHRYSESPCLNLYSSVSLISRSLAPACFRRRVSSTLGGISGGSKIKKMLISEPIWEVWEHSKSHWTSPLGPLGGCGGLGSLNGAKHSLPGSVSAKSAVKPCKVTDLHESSGILHFKPR